MNFYWKSNYYTFVVCYVLSFISSSVCFAGITVFTFGVAKFLQPDRQGLGCGELSYKL